MDEYKLGISSCKCKLAKDNIIVSKEKKKKGEMGRELLYACREGVIKLSQGFSRHLSPVIIISDRV